MTTPEHTLVGLHAAIALGAHQRYGWSLVALAAIASNLPDWDGLPMLLDMARFERGHRVWGHNFFVIVPSSLMLAVLQFRFHWIEAIASRSKRFLPQDVVVEQPQTAIPLTVLFLVCVAAQAIHLPCDMVVSGGNGLSDWHIQPFWPLSDVGYVYPLIPWGDVGPTVILMSGVLILARFRKRLALHSMLTLLALIAYLSVRGLMQ